MEKSIANLLDFNMNPVFLRIGPLEIRYYGLMYIIAIVLSFVLLNKEIHRKKIPLTRDDIYNFIIFTVLGGILSARIYYVIFNWDYYSTHLREVLAIWKGGLASHGGFIGGFIVAYFYLKHFKVSISQMADSVLPLIILGEAFVRFGNFMNGEAHGVPTNLPWGIVFPKGSPAGDQFPNTPIHPTMLYQLFYNLMVFLFIWLFLRKKDLRAGFVASVSIILYSIGRFFIEGLRADSLYIGKFRIAQVMSISLILLMLSLIYIKKLWLKK